MGCCPSIQAKLTLVMLHNVLGSFYSSQVCVHNFASRTLIYRDVLTCREFQHMIVLLNRHRPSPVVFQISVYGECVYMLPSPRINRST